MFKCKKCSLSNIDYLPIASNLLKYFILIYRKKIINNAPVIISSIFWPPRSADEAHHGTTWTQQGQSVATTRHSRTPWVSETVYNVAAKT